MLCTHKNIIEIISEDCNLLEDAVPGIGPSPLKSGISYFSGDKSKIEGWCFRCGALKINGKWLPPSTKWETFKSFLKAWKEETIKIMNKFPK